MKSKIVKNHSSSHIWGFWGLLLLVYLVSGGWVNAQHTTEFEFFDTATPAVLTNMQTNTGAVFESIHNAYFKGNQQGLIISAKNATEDAIKQIQRLWSTSRFYCSETEIFQPVLQTPKGLQVRNISVYFEQGATNEDKYQDMVFEYTPDGRISDAYIAIAKHQYVNFFKGSTSVTDYRLRQLICGFVEDFRTAYNRKDLPYLEKVYSDDALIIVGKELQSKGDGLKPNVTYDVVPRDEYMRRLRATFQRNAYINIKFEEIEVVQQDKRSPVYGVTLRQEWNSSVYSDVGWLFLMIDFENEDRPQIWVRTWQPISIPRDKVFWPGDFPNIKK